MLIRLTQYRICDRSFGEEATLQQWRHPACAQFASNRPVYVPDAVPVPEFSAGGQRYSLLEYILRQTEQLHGRIRRFTSPDEHAFYPDAVPNLVLPPLKYPEV